MNDKETASLDIANARAMTLNRRSLIVGAPAALAIAAAGGAILLS